MQTLCSSHNCALTGGTPAAAPEKTPGRWLACTARVAPPVIDQYMLRHADGVDRR